MAFESNNSCENMSKEEKNAKLNEVRSLLRYSFEAEITDENIRHFIFGKHGYSESVIKETNSFPMFFKNILTLSFYFAYACYQRDLNEGYGDLQDLKGHVASRVKRYLEDTLVKNQITMSLVEFVLADIQADLSLGEKSELKASLFNLGTFDSGFNFQPYLKAISDYEMSPNRYKASKLDLTSLLQQLVENLTFLKKYKLIEDAPGEFSFVSETCIKKQKLNIALSYNERYDELPVNHLFFRDENARGIIFRLYSLEIGEKGEGSVRQNVIRLRYVSSGNQSRTFIVPDEDGEESHLSKYKPSRLYEEIVAFPWDVHKSFRTAEMDTMRISQIHTVNYKYLKPMALAISDVLSVNDDCKKKLYNRFLKQYPYIFEQKDIAAKTKMRYDCNSQGNKVEKESYELLDWDSVTIMLLIEASPSVVLEAITKINKDLFYQICHDLYKRVYDVENLEIFNAPNDKIKSAVEYIIEKKLILSKESNFGKLSAAQTRDKLFPKASAMLLLSKLNDLSNDDIEENLAYAGNLATYISLLKKTKEEPDADKRIKYTCMILGETLKRVICFYEGILEYGKRKYFHDLHSRRKSLSKKDIEKAQKTLESAFISAAQNRAASLPTNSTDDPASVLSLLNVFLTLCQQCARAANNKSSQHLVVAVGRFEMVDSSRFCKLADRLSALQNQPSSQSVESWYEITMEIFEYFKTGSTRDLSMEDDLLSAVYPFTVAFNKGRENPDGYRTITFSLNIDSEDQDKEQEINVLSEFRYDHNDTYYCLPNIIRSNYKWWIDPILISFRDFNKIFSDIREENEE